jgi:DNA-binding CsgD family transcriptional regulator
MSKTQYHCLIKQCVVSGCETWFIGTPRSRFCDPHKKLKYDRMKDGWDIAKANNGIPPGRPSRFNERQIKEIRRLFQTYSAEEIAERFGCKPSLVYKYVERDPIRYRVKP